MSISQMDRATGSDTFDTANRIYEYSHDSKINLGLDSFENLLNLEISCSYWISKYKWTLDWQIRPFTEDPRDNE